LPVVEVMGDGSGWVLAPRVSSGGGGGTDPAEAADRARRIVEREGALRLLVLVERIGMLEALSLRSRLPLARDLAPHVERIAVVGDQRWLRGALAAAPDGGRAEVRLFRSGELEAAWAWLSSGA
jgi:hypothetical protein